jgi:hypothetical protein
MTHAEVFATFESLDIDDNVIVERQDGEKKIWTIYDVHLEDEGLYVQHFPIGQGTVELAFIPVEPPCVITAVKQF